MGIKGWLNVLLEHWISKKDHRETLDAQNMRKRMGLGTQKGGRCGILVFRHQACLGVGAETGTQKDKEAALSGWEGALFWTPHFSQKVAPLLCIPTF